ncbi:MAG: pyridoxamine 5'-phosphate oxidase family protein [Actinomycetota bacterium]|nr:pyridoxamine 5'-phosphate oxidase family protein [Actinomycetota bacterium]
MHETPLQLERLQGILDRSAEEAGAHLRSIVTPERRLGARLLCDRLVGMRLLVVATATGDGRPLAGPVDGYFIQGSWYFGSARESVRMKHLARRPAVSATHVAGENFAVTVHGQAELFDMADRDHPELREAMLAHYLPLQGPAFAEWLENSDALGARIEPSKMFVYFAPGG